MGLFHRRSSADVLPEGWEAEVSDRLVHWAYLDDEERERLGDLVGRLLSEKYWEAANGFSLTSEMKLLIAAQAALLILGLSFEHLHEVNAIIVHPTTMVLEGPRGSPVPGLMTDAPMHILGQAAEHGPVVIAWDEVQRNARHPERGHNVVFHEFAHKIDMLDHLADGTPPLPPEEFQRWVEVCTREYELLQTAEGDELLGAYAAVNPAEFFAVATEVFFTRPLELRDEKPELYGVISDFYNQDPVERVARRAAGE